MNADKQNHPELPAVLQRIGWEHKNMAKLLDLLERLHQLTSMALVLISHDEHLAGAVTEQTWTLRAGRVSVGRDAA